MHAKPLPAVSMAFCPCHFARAHLPLRRLGLRWVEGQLSQLVLANTPRLGFLELPVSLHFNYMPVKKFLDKHRLCGTLLGWPSIQT
jgi:hypothetical protein